MYAEEQVLQGIVRYINAEVVSRMNGTAKFLAGTVMARNASRLPDLLRKYAETAKNVGLYNTDGTIDVDAWCNALRQSMKDYCGGKAELNLPVVGAVVINADDINTLQRYIRGEL